MLRTMRDLEDYAIGATDGTIGHVKDFYFDDKAWVIRYLVVDTGTWLSSRKVLISPFAVGLPNWPEKLLPVSITKEQVKNSPDIDTDKPVSRQSERQYLGYYGYPIYWGGAGLWGEGLYPSMMMPSYANVNAASRAVQSAAENTRLQAEEARHQKDDPHLRSCKSVVDHHIEATDGDIGHVQGFLVDEATWAIRYMIVNTSNWWLGHQVLVSPHWIANVRWPDATVTVKLNRQQVKDAPAYDPEAQVDRKQEMDIHKHYGRPGYWKNEMKREPGQPGRIELKRHQEITS
jgi:hypothetical protein